MRWTTTLALATGLLPVTEAAAAPCPTWRERQTMDCMRGYVRVDPSAFVLATDRPGAAVGASLGLFRAFNFERDHGFALAFGGRAGHDLVFRGADVGFERRLHAGPELRLGGVNRRVFGFMLVRGGYTRRFDAGRAADALYYGLGTGLWGRVGKRFLLGAEGALDIVQFKGEGAAPALFLSLTLGAWL